MTNRYELPESLLPLLVKAEEARAENAGLTGNDVVALLEVIACLKEDIRAF